MSYSALRAHRTQHAKLWSLERCNGELSSKTRELLELGRAEVQPCVRRRTGRRMLTRSENLHLADMSVSAILVARQNRELHTERTQARLVLERRRRIKQSDAHPPTRLVQVDELNLLEIMIAGAGFHRDLFRGVAFIELEVRVQRNLFQLHAFLEVDGDMVRLRAVRLPERVDVAVSQLFDSIARFGR